MAATRTGRRIDDAQVADLYEAVHLGLAGEDGKLRRLSTQAAAERVGVSRSTAYKVLGDQAAAKRVYERVLAARALEAAPQLRRKKPRGRPKKGEAPESLIADDEVRERVCTLLAKGHTIEAATRSAGISRTTWARWKKKGEAGEEPYASYVAEIDEAEATGCISLEGRVMSGEPGWQGAQQMLRWREPQRYGDRKQIEMTTGGDLAELSDEELADELAMLEGAEADA